MSAPLLVYALSKHDGASGGSKPYSERGDGSAGRASRSARRPACLYTTIYRTTTLPECVPSVRQVVRWIAQLGGFLGRKGDGEPGITAIWRGWSRLADIADIYLILHPSEDMGNS